MIGRRAATNRKQATEEGVGDVEVAAADTRIPGQLQVDTRGHHCPREGDEGQEEVMLGALASDRATKSQPLCRLGDRLLRRWALLHRPMIGPAIVR